MLKQAIASLGLVLLASGCGTLVDTASIQCASAHNGPRVYGGVRTNVELMSTSTDWIGITVLVLDTLPSLVCDTVLLPASIPKHYAGPTPAK